MARTRALQGNSAPTASQPTKARKRRDRSPSAISHEPLTKRAQRTAVASEQRLAHALEDAVEAVEPQIVVDTSKATNNNDTNTLADDNEAPSRRVRFSGVGSGFPSPPGTQDHLASASTTPPRAHTSASPARTPDPASVRSSKHTRRSSITSTTSNLVHSSPLGLVEEINYVPLRQVLDDRSRRRLRRSHLSEEINDVEQHERADRRTRHELEAARAAINAKDRRLQELEWELESQRQFSIEIGNEDEEENESETVRDMRREIATLKKEIAEHRSSSFEDSLNLTAADDVSMDGDDDDDDAVHLVLPEDIGIVQSSPTPELRFNSDVMTDNISSNIFRNATPNNGSTQIVVPDPTHELELARFEQEITRLSRMHADDTSALKLVMIEMQALGLTSPDEPPDMILPSIRALLAQIRVELDELLPQFTVAKYQNGELLLQVVATIREMLAQTEAQEVSLEKYKEMNSILTKQNNGLLDKLSEVDQRHQQLSQRWVALDHESERKSKRVAELEQLLTTAEDKVDDRDEIIAQRDETIAKAGNENMQLAGTIERLQTALTSYRDEISGLEGLITRMEAEHKDHLKTLNEEHMNAISELQDEVGTSVAHLHTAEAELDAKTTLITLLEQRCEAAETELEALEVRLVATQNELEQERVVGEELEGDLEDRRAEIEALSRRISILETSLNELRDELQSLRTITESERHQREAAELELDSLNSQIVSLNKRIQEEGICSNDLRQKLFEVQEDWNQQIEDLQGEAEQREERHHVEITAETERREAADRKLKERNAMVAELESRITELDSTVEELLKEKVEVVTEREKQVEEVTTDLYASRQQFAELTARKTVEIETLQGNIADLNERLHTATADIGILHDEARTQVAAHTKALAERDASIDSLTADNADANDRIAILERKNSSLEHRVEEEATAMLDLSSRFASVESAMKSNLAEQAATIADLKQRLADAYAAKDQGFASRDGEIHSLRTLTKNRDLEVIRLQGELVTVEQHGRAERDKAADVFRRILAGFRSELEKGEEEVRAYDDETKDKESVPLTQENKTMAGKKVRRSRRRIVDSGIGVADEEGEAMGEEVY